MSSQKRSNNIEQESKKYDLHTKIEKLEKKSNKTFENLMKLLDQTVAAIQNTENEIQAEGEANQAILSNLHNRMTEIKPITNIKNEFNKLYKNISGVSKTIEQLQPPFNQEFLKVEPIFSEDQFRIIEQNIADYYLRQKDYQAAQIFMPQQNNPKIHLYEQCQKLKECILRSDFDPTIQWIEKKKIIELQRVLGYQLKKLKIISLAKQKRGDQAIDYFKKEMSIYAQSQSVEISLLMGYLLALTQDFWAESSELSQMLQQRYQIFENIKLEPIADYFVEVFYKIHNLNLENPIIKCYEVGSKYSQKIIEKVSHLPPTHEIPKVLPIQLELEDEDKYHSQFLCPINRETYGSDEKCVVLKCGHMLSENALGKIIENRNARRKLKCPVCQKEHQADDYTRVEF